MIWRSANTMQGIYMTFRGFTPVSCRSRAVMGMKGVSFRLSTAQRRYYGIRVRVAEARGKGRYRYGVRVGTHNL